MGGEGRVREEGRGEREGRGGRGEVREVNSTAIQYRTN